MRNEVPYKMGESFVTLLLWRGCILTLSRCCCEPLSQLSGAKAWLFVGLWDLNAHKQFQSTLTFSDCISLFPLHLIFFSLCCQTVSVSFFLNSSFLLLPQLFSSHSHLSHLCIHWWACSGLACWWVVMQPRQVSIHNKNGELKGSSRARLPKYLCTDWLISTLKMSHLSPHTKFLTVSKGPLFLTTSSLPSHLHCGRIAPLLLTKTDTIEPVFKVSLGQDDVNNS